MPREHSLSINVRFSGKKITSTYISRKKGDHYYIQTRHNDLFSHHNLFLGKRKEKLARKARVNTVASISDRAHAHGMGISAFACTNLKFAVEDLSAYQNSEIAIQTSHFKNETEY